MAATKPPRAPRAASLSATKQAQAEYVVTCPLKHQQAVRKSLAGALSPRSAIRVKCLTCSNFQRDEVTGCNVVLCPLWAIRPYQKDSRPQGAAEKELTNEV